MGFRPRFPQRTTRHARRDHRRYPRRGKTEVLRRTRSEVRNSSQDPTTCHPNDIFHDYQNHHHSGGEVTCPHYTMIQPEKIFGRLGNKMFQGAYLYAQWKREQIPDIYVQDPEYFDDFRDDIRVLYGEGITEIDKVAIHVRRGDYVRNPFYVDLSLTDYYEKAMAEFPNEKFLVFSDDIPFCENYFDGDEYEFNYEPEVEALNTLASCKGIIMANSSFSWWGAYLSNAKVIVPLLWHPDGVERTKLLPEWTKL